MSDRLKAGFFVRVYDPVTDTYLEDIDIEEVEALGYRRHLADTTDDEWREVECATDRDRRRLNKAHGFQHWKFMQ